MSPDEEAEQGDRHAGESDERITEQALLGVDRNQLADDSHRRQNHDVHGRMGIEPEKVLEQNRVTAVTRIENANAEHSFGNQQQQGDAEHRSGEHLDDGRGIKGPEEQRHLEPAHSRRPHGIDGDQEVDAGENGAEAKDKRA